MDQFKHHYIRNTALPYVPDASPTTSEQVYLVSGSNILTSQRELLERRPGFATFEPTPTTFSNTIRRAYTWRRWNSSFYLMVNEVSGSQSKIYKLKIGTDASLILIYTSTSTQPFDFTTANNYLFMANGTDMLRWDGTTSTAEPWGIGISPMFRTITAATNATPIVITMTGHGYATGDQVVINDVTGNYAANGTWTITVLGGTTFSLNGSVGNGTFVSGVNAINAPSVIATTGTIVATVGYKYVFGYGNSVTSHMSDVSDASARIGPFTANGVRLIGNYSTDTQVDQLRIFRTTDGGDGIFFEIQGSPFPHTAHSSTFNIIDNTDDIDLKDEIAPTPGMIDRPYSGYQPTNFASRLWYFKNNEVHYSAYEEQGDVGAPEESFPLDNNYKFESEVTGLGTVEDALLVFTARSVWRIEGDSLDTFTRTKVFDNMGLRERAALARIGKGCAFLDSGDVLRVTNGFTQEEISLHIRGDLEGIDHTKASLAFHCDGRRNWLILLDQEDAVARVYDVDQSHWLPPWSINARAIHSGETSAGVVDLFYGISTNKVVRLTPTTYVDDGATYAANAVLGLLDVCERASAGEVGYLKYLALERNAIALSTVKYLTDDDPLTGTFTTISEVTDPPYRVAGTNLVEKWYQTQVGPAARRVSIRFDWAAASTNFKLYSFDLAHEVAPQ